MAIRAPEPPAIVPSLPRGRATLDATGLAMSVAFQTPLPPPDFEHAWRTFHLDRQHLGLLGAHDLLEILRDLSPEMAKALWDWLRFCNPGYEYAVTTLAGAPDPEGQALLDAFVFKLAGYYGSADVPLGKLFHGAWLRGALFYELVLGPDGEMLDLATPDPLTARFRLRMDPQRGQVWELGQWQPLGPGGSAFVSLEARPTVQYVPVDPSPGKPYGRAIAAAGLFACWFILGILKDLRRVVQQQGYEHLDLKVVGEILQQQMPPDVQASPTQQKAWIDQTLKEIADYYGHLEPDDAFVHTDAVEVTSTRGAVNGDSISGFGGLLEALERMALRALKSMPLLMGITDGVSEANANRQYEVYVAAVKAIQHLLEDSLGVVFAFGLRARGRQCRVRWRFAEIRGAEEFRDEQIRQLRGANALFEYLAGFVTHAAAATYATGGEEAESEPLAVPTMYGSPPTPGDGQEQTETEPGAGVPSAPPPKKGAGAPKGKANGKANGTAKRADPTEWEDAARRFVELVGAASGTNGHGGTHGEE